MARFEFVPEESQVWIQGSSSVHPIHATATGVTGWVEVATTRSGVASTPKLAGEVRIAVGLLQSGNPLVDRETRRRIDARRFPEIVGTVTSATRPAAGRLAVTGDLAFRGEVRSVEGEVTAVVEDGRLVIEGAARFDVREWGLQPPKVALLRVHPDIDVRIHLIGRPAA